MSQLPEDVGQAVKNPTLMDYVRGTAMLWWLRFKVRIWYRLRGSRLYGTLHSGDGPITKRKGGHRQQWGPAHPPS